MLWIEHEASLIPEFEVESFNRWVTFVITKLQRKVSMIRKHLLQRLLVGSTKSHQTIVPEVCLGSQRSKLRHHRLRFSLAMFLLLLLHLFLLAHCFDQKRIHQWKHKASIALLFRLGQGVEPIADLLGCTGISFQEQLSRGLTVGGDDLSSQIGGKMEIRLPRVHSF